MHRHNNLQKYSLTINDFPKIYSPIMRMAKKYGAERLLELFTDALLEAWPSDWKTYIMVLKSREAKLAMTREVNPNEDYGDMLHPDPGALHV